MALGKMELGKLSWHLENWLFCAKQGTKRFGSNTIRIFFVKFHNENKTGLAIAACQLLIVPVFVRNHNVIYDLENKNFEYQKRIMHFGF